MVRTDCHTFDPLFSPRVFTPTSAQNPCFYQNRHPKSYFFHCPEFWKCFSQKPLISWNLRKSYPNVPYFYGFCDWKTPYFLPCIHMVYLRGMLPPQTRLEAGKFCILETESCNLVNTFRCKFNKGEENKISVLQTQPTQLCIMYGFHWRAGMINRLSSLVLWSTQRLSTFMSTQRISRHVDKTFNISTKKTMENINVNYHVRSCNELCNYF